MTTRRNLATDLCNTIMRTQEFTKQLSEELAENTIRRTKEFTDQVALQLEIIVEPRKRATRRKSTSVAKAKPNKGLLFLLLAIVLIVEVVVASGYLNNSKGTKVHVGEIVTNKPITISQVTATATPGPTQKVVGYVTVVEPTVAEEQAEEVAVATPIPTVCTPTEATADYVYNITYDEKILIAKVVYVEARGESFEGQVAVAATVFNRYVCDDPAIENSSISSVVHQSGAYAPISGVTTKQALSCMDAVESACKGADPTRKVFPNGARFFYAQGKISAYQERKREGVTKLVIGNHTFHDDFAD